MPISKAQKARTREKILQRAAVLFRRKGYHGVGIDTIMNSARLTRGGFYSHFRSKRDLFLSVLKLDHGFQRLLRERRGNDMRALDREARVIISDYLEPAHRREVANGCTLSALAFDTARADRGAQRAYSQKVHELATEFARGYPDVEPNDPRILAAIVLAVGGLTLTRAMGDADLAAKMSQACRANIEQLLSLCANGCEKVSP